MIGFHLSDGDALYEVVGEPAPGRFVLARLDAFESPVEVSAGELAQRFKVDAPEPSPAVDPVAGWTHLAETAQRDWQSDPDSGETPEDVFARVGLDHADAKRLGHRA